MATMPSLGLVVNPQPPSPPGASSCRVLKATMTLTPLKFIQRPVPKPRPAAPPPAPHKMGKAKIRERRLAYAQRNSIIRKLGFASYGAYLDSRLWAKLRVRVLRERGGVCKFCGLKATQVHHEFYDYRNLRGFSTKGLVPVCGSCHEEGEFNEFGDKLSPRAATRRMERLTKRYGFSNKNIVHRVDEEVRAMDEEFRSIVR